MMRGVLGWFRHNGKRLYNLWWVVSEVIGSSLQLVGGVIFLVTMAAYSKITTMVAHGTLPKSQLSISVVI